MTLTLITDTDRNAPLRKAINGFEAAKILNPMTVKTMTEEDVKKHIDVLNCTFPFIDDEFVLG